MRASMSALALAACLVAIACGGVDAPPTNMAPRVRLDSAEGKAAGFPPLSGHILAASADMDPLPMLALGEEGGLVLFRDEAGWATVAVDASGQPAGRATRLEVDAERATLKASGSGFLALFDRAVEENHALSLLALSADGAPAGQPQVVTQAADEISWIDFFTSPAGTLVLWEIPREGRFDVVVAAASADGSKILGSPVTVVRGALGWGAVQAQSGIAIAAITPAGATADGSERGTVDLFEVSTQAKVTGPTVVGPKGSAHLDVDIARAGKNFLLAWTDDRELDSVVLLASVAPGGKIVSAPRQAMAPRGDQALVHLVSAPAGGSKGPAGRALLAWEEVGAAAKDPRGIKLGLVDDKGRLGAERATLWMTGPGAPDLVSDESGFSAITLAPAILSPEYEIDLGAGAEQPVWPSFARLGPDLAIRGGEPIRLDEFGATDGVPHATFGLSCRRGRCTTMALGPEGELALMDLPIRKSPWLVAARRVKDDAPPLATRLVSMVEGAPLARVDATPVDDDSGARLAAWTTVRPLGDPHAEAGDADSELGSVLVAPITPDASIGQATTLSKKATAVGGVSIASRPGKERADTVVAWIEAVNGEPQVFVARVRPDGTKIKSKALTKASRPAGGGALLGASDVAIAEVDDGFLVAWVDTRDGNGEVYAAKVDRDLGKMIKDIRVTDAPGDAADVRIAWRGDALTLVWSDSRTSAEGADIYLARLDPKTLEKKAPEARLFASSGHSRSPSIAHTGDGLLIAWVEDVPVELRRSGEAGTEGIAGGARIAEIDGQGRVIGAPRSVGERVVTAVALSCGEAKSSDGRCRLLLTQTDEGSASISAIEYELGSGPKRSKTLATLGGGLVSAPTMVFAGADGKDLLFTDDLPGGRGRLRLLSVDWGD